MFGVVTGSCRASGTTHGPDHESKNGLGEVTQEYW